MKALLVMGLLLSSFPAFPAQTNIWRVVDGVVYNARYNTNWNTLYGWYRDYITQEFIIEDVTDRGVVCRITHTLFNPLRVETLTTVLVKRLPNQDKLATGDRLDSIVWVMRVKNTRIGNRTLATYDFGDSPPLRRIK